MKSFILILVLGFVNILSLSSWALQGSDGPTPFSQIKAPELYYLPTESPVVSFAILEKSQEMAYVDTNQVLNIFDLKSGSQKILGKFTEKLLPFTDQQEKYLLSGSHRILTEISGEVQEREIQLPLASRFLFWNQSNLYLMKKLEKIKKGTWRLSFFALNPERNVVQHKNCEFEVSDPLLELQLGEGHRFPELLVYNVKQNSGESALSLYKLDLRARSGRCALRAFSEKRETFKGAILSVTQVSNDDEVVVLTEHPEWNVYFGKPGSWNVATIPGGVSYIPNPQAGLIINLNRKKGVGIYSIKTLKFINVEMPIDQDLLSKQHTWVTAKGDSFYISGKDLSGKRGVRTVYQLDLVGLN